MNSRLSFTALKLENLKHITRLKPPITNNLYLERSLELLLLPNPDINSCLGCLTYASNLHLLPMH